MAAVASQRNDGLLSRSAVLSELPAFASPPRVRTVVQQAAQPQREGVRYDFLLNAVPFTHSQGVSAASPSQNASGVTRQASMYSPFASSFPAAGPVADSPNTVLPMNASHGSSSPCDAGAACPDKPQAGASAALAAAPLSSTPALPQPPAPSSAAPAYSPFMMFPMGPPVQGYLQDTAPAGSPQAIAPASPMSPGVVFHPSPFGHAASMPLPNSPRAALFAAAAHASPFSMNVGNTGGGSYTLGVADAAAAAVAAQQQQQHAVAALAAAQQLPASLYYSGSGAGGGLPLGINGLGGGGMQGSAAAAAAAAAASALQNGAAGFGGAAFHHQVPAYLQAYSPAALGLDLHASGHLGALEGLAPGAAAAAAAAAAHMRRNMSTPPMHHLHSMTGHHALGGYGALGAAAAAAAALGAAGQGMVMPPVAQMSRLRVAHSADLAALDPSKLAAAGSARPSSRFKNARSKNAEPKIGPDGQPRLNARQRRTLRRAKERAMRGLLEVSKALLEKADVQVPSLTQHLAALEELAAQEAHKAEAEGGSDDEGGSPRSLSPSASRSASSSVRASPLQAAPPGSAAAAAAVAERNVEKLAMAAVAVVAAAAAGRDTSSAAASAQAAASAVESAAAGVLQPSVGSGGSSGSSADTTDGGLGAALAAAVAAAAAGGAGGGSSTVTPAPSPARTTATASPYSALSTPQRGGSGAGQPPLPPAAGRAPSASGGTPGGGAGGGLGPDLGGIDITGLIQQLSQSKGEGMVDEKLIRDLEIIQSLMVVLRSPDSGAPSERARGGGGGSSGGMAPPLASQGSHGARVMTKGASFTYGSGMTPLPPAFSMPQ